MSLGHSVPFKNIITYLFKSRPYFCSTFIDISSLLIIPLEARLSLDFENDIIGLFQLRMDKTKSPKEGEESKTM